MMTRFAVLKKLQGKGIYVYFPAGKYFESLDSFYLISHDELLEIIAKQKNYLNTLSWKEGGAYSCVSLSETMMSCLEKYKKNLPSQEKRLQKSTILV